VRLLHHAREMGIVGLFNVLRHLRMFRRIYDDLIDEIARQRPDAVVLVDYPEFNLRVAKRCRAMGIRVIYYISPQVWAWRPGRVKKIAKIVDLMIVIFPFEEDLYRARGVPVVYVGHPLIDELAGVRRGEHDPGTPLKVALLPGSRRSEVSALLPPMLDAVANLRREGALDAFLIQAPTISSAELLAIMQTANIYVRIVPRGAGEDLAAADVALSSSGTATLECAVIGTPVIVMYRLSAATHWFAQRLVKLRHFSLVNIVAGKKVVSELLQHDVNGERIAADVRVLARPDEHARIRAELAAVRVRLGDGGASRRAAEAIMSVVDR
jgi:lipid-A-disaccharide synthase